ISGSLLPLPSLPMQAAVTLPSGGPKIPSSTPALVPSMKNEPEQAKRHTFPWRRALLLGLALLLLFWVGSTISLTETLATLAHLGPGDLLILAGVNLLVFSTFAGRWWLLLRAQGYHLPYWRLISYRITAFAISYFTPGSHFGGEPYQIYAVSRW